MSSLSRFFDFVLFERDAPKAKPARPETGDLLCDEPDLFAAFQEGRARALHRVFIHYSPIIARIIASGLGLFVKGQRTRLYPEQASLTVEDVLHETFVRAFQSSARQSYAAQGPYKNYLLSIARNYLLQQLRHHHKQIPMPWSSDAPDANTWDSLRFHEGSEPPPLSPLESCVHQEVTTAVRLYTDTLPERDRDILHARYVERIPRNIVQRQLGISLMQLRYQEILLLAGLKKYLKRSGFFD